MNTLPETNGSLLKIGLLTPTINFQVLLLMEEILHHLGCKKITCKSWDFNYLSLNWLKKSRISGCHQQDWLVSKAARTFTCGFRSALFGKALPKKFAEEGKTHDGKTTWLLQRCLQNVPEDRHGNVKMSHKFVVDLIPKQKTAGCKSWLNPMIFKGWNDLFFFFRMTCSFLHLKFWKISFFGGKVLPESCCSLIRLQTKNFIAQESLHTQ